MNILKIFALTSVMLLASTLASASDSTEKSNDWQFGLDLYIWVPSISGELLFTPPLPSQDVSVGVDQLIDALQMVFMGSFEARKGSWSGFTDLVYMDLKGDKSKSVTVPDGTSQIQVDGDLEFKSWVWTLAGAYTPWRSQNSYLDLFAGARLLALDTELQLSGAGPLGRDQNLSQSAEYWDGIIGLKGRMGINDHWFVPYYADVGTGDTELTWQMAAGIGYGFGWGDIILDYRHLEYSQDGKDLLQDLALSGGRLGFVFRF